MGKKSRKLAREADLIVDEDFDEMTDYQQEMEELGRDIYSTDWGSEEYEKDSRGDARRKIEHRRDMKKLYSQLDEWEEFGMSRSWN